MTADRCRHGQTFGTCKSKCEDREVVSFTFIGPEGEDFVTHLYRPAGLSDVDWGIVMDGAAEAVADRLDNQTAKIAELKKQRAAQLETVAAPGADQL